MSEPAPYCDRLRGYHSAFLDCETSFLIDRMLERHLADCAACSEELDLLRRSVALVRELPAPEAGPRELQRVVEAVTGPRGGTPIGPALEPGFEGASF